MRSCVVVSDPDVISDQRFPLVCVVPIGGTAGVGSLYPPLAPGESGLVKKSFALIDQVDRQAACPTLVWRTCEGGMAAIDEGLAIFLGLGDRLHG